MKKIGYGLIISDFDGTLLRSDGTIAENTKQSILRYVENGGRFAVSTGRTPASILPRVRELGLTGVVACAQGSSIVDIKSGELLLDGRIDNKKAVEICRLMESLGLHIHVYEPWCFYSNKDNDFLMAYENVVKTKGERILDRPLSQFLEETGLCPSKLAVLIAAEDRERIFAALSEKYQTQEYYVTASSDFLVEVGSNAYTKGTAVQFLSNYYNVDIKKTIGIGDQRNDLPMIEAAWFGIAVKNADSMLKEKAFVAPYTNDENAVGNLIEEYGYAEE